MSKCIQTLCKCAGYKEPQRPKNTLLQFKLNCQECGHQASEHRKLTPVDHYIKSQVAAGKKLRCTFLISSVDIPTSPIFGAHDLLMLPSEDEVRPADVKENSVQCTCRGFKVPDVVRLCQAYRTHSMEDVESKLKDSLCSFCSHPLLSHSLVSGKSCQPRQVDLPPLFMGFQKAPPLGPHHGLCLKASSSLAFSPANPKCVELLASSGLHRDAGGYALLIFGKGYDQKLRELALLECGRKSVACSSASSTCEGAAQTSAASETHRKEEFPSESDKPTLPVAKKAKLMPAVAMRGKKSRRSSRLATKKARLEEMEMRRTLKGLKGAKRLYGEEEEEDSGGEEEWTEEEMSLEGEAAAEFVGSLGKSEEYVRFPVPQSLTGVGGASLLMSAAWVGSGEASGVRREEGLGGKDNEAFGGRACLVALGSKERSSLFLATVSTSQRGEGLEWLDLNGDSGSGGGTVECIQVRTDGAPDGTGGGRMLAAAGLSSGKVCVWTLEPSGKSLSGRLVLNSMVDCKALVLVVSLSPSSSDTLLAMGTLSGKVSFSFLSNAVARSEAKADGDSVEGAAPTLPVSEARSMPCSCAPVSCIAWGSEGRIVAVGACDDSIQILHQITSLPPPKQLQKHSAKSKSIRSFCKTTSSHRWPKFVLTHTLKGHASFVSGLTFSRGHYLTSVGWDGQMLFWRHFSKGRKSVVLSTASKGRQYQLAVEILEPVGGYKIGPSPSAQFLPSLIRPLACGCGFLVAVDDKLGGVTVACYTNS